MCRPAAVAVDDPQARRRILRLSALAFFGTLAVIGVLNARMKSTGGPGILSLEFAGSRHRALQIMDEWGPKGITAARWGNVVDYGFLAAYAVFLTVAVAAARRRAVESGQAGLARVGRLIVAFPVVAASADAIQNGALLLLLGRHAESITPPLALVCGVLTAVLALISLSYLAVVRLSRRADVDLISRRRR